MNDPSLLKLALPASDIGGGASALSYHYDDADVNNGVSSDDGSRNSNDCLHLETIRVFDYDDAAADEDDSALTISTALSVSVSASTAKHIDARPFHIAETLNNEDADAVSLSPSSSAVSADSTDSAGAMLQAQHMSADDVARLIQINSALSAQNARLRKQIGRRTRTRTDDDADADDDDDDDDALAQTHKHHSRRSSSSAAVYNTATALGNDDGAAAHSSLSAPESPKDVLCGVRRRRWRRSRVDITRCRQRRVRR